MLLTGDNLRHAKDVICKNHYTHSTPSGKTYGFQIGDAIVLYSIPANPYLRKFMLGDCSGALWELSRLWAPDGHDANLLTLAISKSAKLMKSYEIDLAGLVSFADPKEGHTGGVYRAASWVFTGTSAEGRSYRCLSTGAIVPRRKFHSGSRHMTKAEIEAMGYQQIKTPGKLRFFRGMSRAARKLWQHY